VLCFATTAHSILGEDYFVKTVAKTACSGIPCFFLSLLASHGVRCCLLCTQGMHGEMLYKCPYWSDSSGHYCGQSVDKIGWFKEFMLNTTLHPPFEQCVGDDDGYVHTLSCGDSFFLFHFYNGHPNASSSFHYINLPKGMRNRQDLVQPWEMKVTLIWKPPSCSLNDGACDAAAADDDGGIGGVVVAKSAGPPPPGIHVFGPKRPGYQPVGITVDEDTLPHILAFTNCNYRNACKRDAPDPPEGGGDGGSRLMPSGLARLAWSDTNRRRPQL
jgi:hypothetical protein